MGSRRGLALVVLCACNAQLGAPRLGTDALGSADGQGPGIDSPTGFGAPTSIAGADLPGVNQDDCTLSSTQTELYFKKPSATGDSDLYWMVRAAANDPWGAPQALSALNTTVNEESPRLSPDELSLYFGRNGDIYVSTRASTTSAWGTPTLVPGVSTPGVYEKWLAVCDANYFMVSRAVVRGTTTTTTDQDLFVGQLDGTSPGTLASELSLPTYNETSAFLSTDCTTALFASNRDGTTQIYTAQRTDPTSTFGAVTLVDYLGTASDNEDPWVSADQRTFVFASIRGGSTTKAVYEATR
jgi:hypothetical protein